MEAAIVMIMSILKGIGWQSMARFVVKRLILMAARAAETYFEMKEKEARSTPSIKDDETYAALEDMAERFRMEVEKL